MRRRTTDRGWHRLVRENWYRDLWLLVITGLVLLALIELQNTIDDMQAGRRQAVETTCAALSAVAQAGREVIAGSPSPPPLSEERALERLGFPPFKTRHAQAERGADAYVASLAGHIVEQVGSRGDRLVLPGGRIDCRAFLKLARTH